MIIRTASTYFFIYLSIVLVRSQNPPKLGTFSEKRTNSEYQMALLRNEQSNNSRFSIKYRAPKKHSSEMGMAKRAFTSGNNFHFPSFEKLRFQFDARMKKMNQQDLQQKNFETFQHQMYSQNLRILISLENFESNSQTLCYFPPIFKYYGKLIFSKMNKCGKFAIECVSNNSIT